MADALPRGRAFLRSANVARDAPVDGTVASSRIATIDNAKAIGIVLVVVGHAPAIAPWLGDTIFAFHVPLFFVLSGLLVAPQRLATPFVARVRGLARSLLLPYLFFFVIAWLYWLVAKRHGVRAIEFDAVSWWQPWEGFVRGTGDALYVDPALWFLPCLFIAASVHHGVARGIGAKRAAIALIAVAWVFTWRRPEAWPPLPWSADCALVAAACYATGAALHEPMRGGRWRRLGPVARAALTTIAFAATIAAVPVIGHVDLSRLTFGREPALYLPVAACGTLGTLLLATLLPGSRLADWLARRTLVIFPLHMLFFSVVTGVALTVLGLPIAFKDGPGWVAVIYVGAALAACVPAARVLERGAPWLFGRSRASSTVARPPAHRVVDPAIPGASSIGPAAVPSGPDAQATMVLIRVTTLDARVLAFADDLAAASGCPVAFVADERDGPLPPCGRPVVGLTVARCAAFGLHCPPDFTWKCGDYGYYLARRRFPRIARFWMIEYDVRFAGGDLASFFAGFAARPQIDFLATFLGPAGWDWHWAITARARDVRPTRCLFPVTRISAAAIDALLAKRVAHGRRRLRRFLWPNDEAMVATTLCHAGFACRDFNDFGRVLYDESTFSFTRPIDGDAFETRPGEFRIYHPVLYGRHYILKKERLNELNASRELFGEQKKRLVAKLNSLTSW